MNKYQEQIADKMSLREKKEQMVIDISEKISKIISISADTLEEDITLDVSGKYNIVLTHRCFSQGWIYLWEIVPVEYKGHVGYTNGKNPEYIEPKGTATINLPPAPIVQHFFELLNENQ